MALTSASTYAQALAQYNDNLSWEGSTAKAILALEAIRWLLVNRAQIFSGAGTQVNWAQLTEEKKKLEEYVGNAGTSNRSTFTQGRPQLW